MRVKFTKDYDHEYESRAQQNFPAGLELTVKREIGEAAIAAGKAKEVKHDPAEHGPDADERAVTHVDDVHDA